jgi:hypothetical protein
MLVFGLSNIAAVVGISVQWYEGEITMALLSGCGYALFLLICRFVKKYDKTIYADEVYDCGDSILVRYCGRERRFQFTEFRLVSYSSGLNPSIWLYLNNQDTEWRKAIIFDPALVIVRYTLESYVDDLRWRIKAAKGL